MHQPIPPSPITWFWYNFGNKVFLACIATNVVVAAILTILQTSWLLMVLGMAPLAIAGVVADTKRTRATEFIDEWSKQQLEHLYRAINGDDAELIDSG